MQSWKPTVVGQAQDPEVSWNFASPVAFNDATSSIQVTHLSWCTCRDRQHPESHLNVLIETRDLTHDSAVAISYAIGDSDRQSLSIGHFRDSTTPIAIELSNEWNLPSLQEQLVQLTIEYTAVWFDQLSIIQTPDEIRRELQRVPQIYGTLGVIVLLPYAPCPCLQEAIELYENNKQYSINYGAVNDFDFNGANQACLYMFPLCSYFNRIWTRQEFAYATNIRVRYCSEQLLNSHERLPVGPLLQPYMVIPQLGDRMDQIFTHLKQQIDSSYISPDYLLIRLFIAYRHFSVNNLIMNIWNLRNRGQTSEKNHGYWAAKFLLGARLTRNSFGDTSFQAEGLQMMHLRASLKEDYVLAIFPMNNGYIVPEDWQSMNLPMLLENALFQTEQINNSIRISFLPTALFNLDFPSTRCRPTLFMRPEHISSISDAYGMFAGALHARCLSPAGHIPIRISNPEIPTSPRAARVMSYQCAFADFTVRQVIEWLVRVIPVDPSFKNTQIRLDNLHTRNFCSSLLNQRFEARTPPEDYESDDVLLRGLFLSALFKQPGDILRWELLSSVDHYTYTYDIVAACFGIVPSVAREKGLGLVVSMQEPPCIGFTNHIVYEELRKAENKQERDLTAFNCEHWLSVNVGLNGISGGVYMLVYDAYYQGERVNPSSIQLSPKGEPVPVYHAGIVWLRHNIVNCIDPAIGAELVVVWEDCNALLL